MSTRPIGVIATIVLVTPCFCCTPKTGGVRDSAASAKSSSITLAEGEYLAAVLSPGPKWDVSKPRDQQPGMMERRAYMRSLFDRGEILFGGPFVDRPGGLAIYRTRSRDQAERLANADPGVKSGLIKAETTCWRIGVSSHP